MGGGESNSMDLPLMLSIVVWCKRSRPLIFDKLFKFFLKLGNFRSSLPLTFVGTTEFKVFLLESSLALSCIRFRPLFLIVGLSCCASEIAAAFATTARIGLFGVGVE